MSKIELIIELLSEYENKQKQYQKQLKDESWPVTAPQVGVLRVIRRNPGISISGLAQKMSIHITTAEGYALRLSRMGYIAIKDSAKGYKKKHLNVTESGMDIVERIPLGFKSLLVDNLMHKADQEEIDLIINGLRIMLKHMEDNLNAK